MPKTALITGVTGQDGAYLSKLLLEKGYKVYGTLRKSSEINLNNLKILGISDAVIPVFFELLEFTNIQRAIGKMQVDEIYNLGAQSSVALSFEQPIFTADVTALGALRILEAIRAVNSKIKFYQASSSEIFGGIKESIQNEKTPFYPRSPYAASKLFAYWMTVNCRDAYGMFACSGILFNHESPLRGPEFVTRKITRSVARIEAGLQNEISLGNLNVMRDWGYAPEYVEAMWLMMQQPEPEDYVIATGETHSLREFIEIAFREIGVDLDWSGNGVEEKGIDRSTGRIFVKVDPAFFRPAEVEVVKGDFSKAKDKLGWEPRTAFEEIVRIMVKHDIGIAENEKRSV